jgi:CBS domain-containing protein
MTHRFLAGLKSILSSLRALRTSELTSFDSKRARTSTVRVADLMTRDVVCVRAGERLNVAAQLMWDSDCGAIPVLTDDGEQVVGMITDRDICMATWLQDCPPSAIAVSRVMSQEVHVSTPDSALADAERVMRSKQVRRVPVVDEQRRVVGILSLADIARHSERSRGRFAPDAPASDEVASTLANICQSPERTSLRAIGPAPT